MQELLMIAVGAALDVYKRQEVFSGDDIDHLDDRLKLQINNPGEKDE